MTETLLPAVVDFVFRTSIAAALVWATVTVLRIGHGATRHVAWSVLLAGMLLMPALRSTVPVIEVPIGQTTFFASSAPDASLAVAPSGDGPAPIWPWLVIAGYVSVAFVLLGRLVAGAMAARRLIRLSDRIDGWSGVRESTLIATPVTVGALRPYILLPHTWRTWSPDALVAVLAHERAHVRRRDVQTTIVAHVNRALFWFHPLAWWLDRQIAVDAEHAADEAAIRDVGERRRYAEVLIQIASAASGRGARVAWPAIGMHGSSRLGARIDRILRGDVMREMSKARKAIVILGCLGAVLGAVACERQAAPPNTETPATGAAPSAAPAPTAPESSPPAPAAPAPTAAPSEKPEAPPAAPRAIRRSAAPPAEAAIHGVKPAAPAPGPPSSSTVEQADEARVAAEFAAAASPGNGIKPPAVLSHYNPQYTSDAMRAKIQGEVHVEAVVLPDGRVGATRVVKSLDTQFGLDESALVGARSWRFSPGTDSAGNAVPVKVTIILEFRLR